MKNKELINILSKLQDDSEIKMVTKFKYKNMIFYNVKDNLFQTDKFGDKLIYKYENGKYHLVKDERLSFIIPLSECTSKDHLNDYYIWK